MQNIINSLFVILFFGLSSCGIADLRTTEIRNDQQSQNDQQKAETLLTNAIKKQGLDKAQQFQTYEVVGSDHWKGMLGKMGKVWKWNKEKMVMRYTVGDFDGQVEVLEGKRKGFIAGIQSWDYYEIKDGAYNTDVKDNKRISFGLAAYHYYYELGSRLANAPFVRYVGIDEIDGQAMEKILVSWGNKKSKDYDQYILWIGKESGLIEATTHTIRDNYLPMSGFLYSSARFVDYRSIDGVMIPFSQVIQLKKPKDKEHKYIHRFTIESFKWDAFPVEKIRPNSTIKPIGDDKKTISLNDALRLDEALDGITLMN